MMEVRGRGREKVGEDKYLNTADPLFQKLQEGTCVASPLFMRSLWCFKSCYHGLLSWERRTLQLRKFPLRTKTVIKARRDNPLGGIHAD